VTYSVILGVCSLHNTVSSPQKKQFVSGHGRPQRVQMCISLPGNWA